MPDASTGLVPAHTPAQRSATYLDFAETIERGLSNGIPREARLFLLGRINFAGERGELSILQVEELQALLDLGPLADVIEFGTFGDLTSE